MHWERIPEEIRTIVLHHLKQLFLYGRSWDCLKVVLKDTEHGDGSLPEVVPRFRGSYHYQNSCVVVHPVDFQEWATEEGNGTAPISLMVDLHGDVGLYVADDAEDDDDPDALLPYSYPMEMGCRFWLSRHYYVEFTSHMVPTHAQFPWGGTVMALRTHWNEWGDGDTSFQSCPMPVMLQKA